MQYREEDFGVLVFHTLCHTVLYNTTMYDTTIIVFDNMYFYCVSVSRTEVLLCVYVRKLRVYYTTKYTQDRNVYIY